MQWGSSWAVPGGRDPSADTTRAIPDIAAVSSAGNTVALFIQTPSGDGIDRKQQDGEKIPTETTGSELVP